MTKHCVDKKPLNPDTAIHCTHCQAWLHGACIENATVRAAHQRNNLPAPAKPAKPSKPAASRRNRTSKSRDKGPPFSAELVHASPLNPRARLYLIDHRDSASEDASRDEVDLHCVLCNNILVSEWNGPTEVLDTEASAQKAEGNGTAQVTPAGSDKQATADVAAEQQVTRKSSKTSTAAQDESTSNGNGPVSAKGKGKARAKSTDQTDDKAGRSTTGGDSGSADETQGKETEKPSTDVDEDPSSGGDHASPKGPGNSLAGAMEDMDVDEDDTASRGDHTTETKRKRSTDQKSAGDEQNGAISPDSHRASKVKRTEAPQLQAAMASAGLTAESPALGSAISLPSPSWPVHRLNTTTNQAPMAPPMLLQPTLNSANEVGSSAAPSTHPSQAGPSSAASTARDPHFTRLVDQVIAQQDARDNAASQPGSAVPLRDESAQVSAWIDRENENVDARGGGS